MKGNMKPITDEAVRVGGRDVREKRKSANSVSFYRISSYALAWITHAAAGEHGKQPCPTRESSLASRSATVSSTDNVFNARGAIGHLSYNSIQQYFNARTENKDE